MILLADFKLLSVTKTNNFVTTTEVLDRYNIITKSSSSLRFSGPLNKLRFVDTLHDGDSF